VGAESTYGGWISKKNFFFCGHILQATYAIEFYHLPDYQAAYVSSFFWISITVGRLLASKKIFKQNFQLEK
jgi:hypothetical protein